MQPAHSRRLMIFLTASALFILSQFYRAAIAVITSEPASYRGLIAGDFSLMSAAFFYAFALFAGVNLLLTGIFYAAATTEHTSALRPSPTEDKGSTLRSALSGIVMLFHMRGDDT